MGPFFSFKISLFNIILTTLVLSSAQVAHGGYSTSYVCEPKEPIGRQIFLYGQNWFSTSARYLNVDNIKLDLSGFHTDVSGDGDTNKLIAQRTHTQGLFGQVTEKLYEVEYHLEITWRKTKEKRLPHHKAYPYNENDKNPDKYTEIFLMTMLCRSFSGHNYDISYFGKYTTADKISPTLQWILNKYPDFSAADTSVSQISKITAFHPMWSEDYEPGINHRLHINNLNLEYSKLTMYPGDVHSKVAIFKNGLQVQYEDLDFLDRDICIIDFKEGYQMIIGEYGQATINGKLDIVESYNIAENGNFYYSYLNLGIDENHIEYPVALGVKNIKCMSDMSFVQFSKTFGGKVSILSPKAPMDQ